MDLQVQQENYGFLRQNLRISNITDAKTNDWTFIFTHAGRESGDEGVLKEENKGFLEVLSKNTVKTECNGRKKRLKINVCAQEDSGSCAVH